MQHSRDVRVHQCGAPLIRERRHGSRRVVSDARQCSQIHCIVGDRCAVGGHPSCERVQIPGTCIVAEPGPRLQHGVTWRFSHVVERGEAREKALVVIDHTRHLRLLEHELGDENAVRVTRAPPREVAAMFAEPRAKAPRELAAPCGVDFNGVGVARTSGHRGKYTSRSAARRQYSGTSVSTSRDHRKIPPLTLHTCRNPASSRSRVASALRVPPLQ